MIRKTMMAGVLLLSSCVNTNDGCTAPLPPAQVCVEGVVYLQTRRALVLTVDEAGQPRVCK